MLPGIKALLAVVVLEWLLMVTGQCGVQGGTLRLLFNLSGRTVKSYCRKEMKGQADTFLVTERYSYQPVKSQLRCHHLVLVQLALRETKYQYAQLFTGLS